MKSIPEWALRARSTWRYRGQERPPFAVVPQPGQESVWDYPRPPRIESDVREVIVRVGAHEIARSRRSVRLLETASPPTFYVPPEDVRREFLQTEGGVSMYANPLPGYELIRGYVSFYPSLVACALDSIAVVAQPAGFMAGGSLLNSSGLSRVNPDPRAGDLDAHDLRTSSTPATLRDC